MTQPYYAYGHYQFRRQPLIQSFEAGYLLPHTSNETKEPKQPPSSNKRFNFT